MKKLLLSTVVSLITVALAAQDCSNLFFSEYVEGSANNKTLEIYNPTSSPVDLSTYLIKRYSNGSPVPTEQLALSGIIQPKDAIVVTNGQVDSLWVESGQYWSLPIWEELYDKGDLHCSGIYPTPMYFNGDDAMTLETVTGGVIDIFGKIGEQPENGWNDIPPTYIAGAQYWTSWTIDQTLIRKATVKKGVSANPAIFMVNTEWDSIPKDSFDSLGFHRCDCATMGINDKPASPHSFVMFPNPATAGQQISFNTDPGWVKAQLISITGQPVRSTGNSNSSREGQLRLQSLSPGIYSIRVEYNDHSIVVQKIMVR